MESLLSLLSMHWDHEPQRAQRRAGVPPARRARQRERFRSVGVADGGRRDACPTFRFMESLLSLLRMHRDHEPTPSPSQGANRGDAEDCLLPSWERGRGWVGSWRGPALIRQVRLSDPHLEEKSGPNWPKRGTLFSFPKALPSPI